VQYNARLDGQMSNRASKGCPTPFSAIY